MEGPERIGNCSNDLESVRMSLGGAAMIAQYSCALVREAMMTLADDSGSPIVLLRSAADGGRATVYCAALAACLRGGERNRCLGVGRMPCATVLRTAHAVSAGRAHTRAVSPDLLQNKVLLR